MMSTFCFMPFEYEAIDCSAASAIPKSSSSAPILRCSRRRRNLAQPPDELELLATRQERIEVRLFRHVAEACAEADEVVGDVAAVEEHGPARWRQQPGQHADRRRLAGAVRPEVAEDVTGADGEAHRVDNRAAGETANEARALRAWLGFRFAEGLGP